MSNGINREDLNDEFWNRTDKEVHDAVKNGKAVNTPGGYFNKGLVFYIGSDC